MTHKASRRRGTQRRRSTRARAAVSLEARQQARTIKTKTLFLREFAACGNVLRSARAAGVGRRTVYNWLGEDPEFKKVYREALADAIDALEEEARRRAVDGVLKPVYQGGRKVGTVREHSDALLMLLLKANKPNKYRERHEHSGKGGGPIRTQTEVRVVKFGGRYKPEPS